MSPPTGGTRDGRTRKRVRPERAGRIQGAGAKGPPCVGLRCAEACGLVAAGRSGAASRRAAQAVVGSARLGSARLGSARLGSARLGSARLGSARLGSARLGSARLGSARLGSARLGSARLGSARLGSARLGSARLGSAHNSRIKTLVGCQVFFHAVPDLSAVVPSPASTAASAGGGHGAAGALPGALLSRRFRKNRMQRAGHGRSGLSMRDCACRGLDGLGGLQPRGTRARTAGTSPRRNESTRAQCVATRRSPVGGSPSCTAQVAHRPPATVAT